MRGQANLLAVPVALLLVTVAVVVALGVAGSALATADGEPVERRVGATVADRLVAPDGSLAVRQNVLTERGLDGLDGATLRSRLGLGSEYDLRVSVGDATVAEAGDPVDGTTVRRLVRVERRSTATLVPADPNATIDLPAPTHAATVRIDPPNGTTVRTVRVDGRVVRRNASGLAGSHRLDLPATESVSIDVTADGPFTDGNLTVRYAPTTARETVLAVTVDA